MNLFTFNLILVLIIILSIKLIFWYLKQNLNYWSKKGIKGPRPLPGCGNTLDYVLKGKSETMDCWLKRYGNIFGIYEGNNPVLVVAIPELIRQILVKDFMNFVDKPETLKNKPRFHQSIAFMRGAEWKRNRTVINSTFTTVNVKNMLPVIRVCSNDLINHLLMATKKGNLIEMRSIYRKYRADIVAKCTLGYKGDIWTDNINNSKNNMYMDSVINFLNDNEFVETMNRYLGPTVGNYLNNCTRLPQLTKYFHTLIKDLVNTRLKANNINNDLLSLMLKKIVTNEEKEALLLEQDVNKIDSGKIYKNFVTYDEVIENTMIVLLSGNEFNSTTLLYCTQELALNQDVQDELYLEVSSLDFNNDIDYYELSKLPCLNAVLSEVLRLHIPAISINRIAEKDCILGETGITVYKGQQVVIPIRAMHRSEQYFPNAHQFNPKRFQPEPEHKIEPYSYLPFSAGPRNCFGEKFALIDIKTCLANLVKHFKIFPTSDMPPGLVKTNMHIKPKRMMVKLIERV